MISHPTVLEADARVIRAERLARSSAPRLPREPQRHRLAAGLRRFADRLDG